MKFNDVLVYFTFRYPALPTVQFDDLLIGVQWDLALTSSVMNESDAAACLVSPSRSFRRLQTSKANSLL